MGSTITSFRLRFNNHKSRINFHSKASDSDKDKDDLIYKHFCSEGYHGVSDIEVMLIDRVFGQERLRDKESQRAYRLRTVAPDGLNSNDFFIRSGGRACEINCLCFVLIVIIFIVTDSFYYFARYVHVWLLLIVCVSLLHITCVFNG